MLPTYNFNFDINYHPRILIFVAVDKTKYIHEQKLRQACVHFSRELLCPKQNDFNIGIINSLSA